MQAGISDIDLGMSWKAAPPEELKTPTPDSSVAITRTIQRSRPNGDTEEIVAAPRVWKSCCFAVEPAAATFIVQTIFSLLLMVFSMSQLVYSKDSEDKAWHVSLLSLLVGIYLPSPRVKKKKE